VALRDRANVPPTCAPARKGRKRKMARTGTVPATDTHRNHQREEVRRLQAYTVEQVAEILHVGRDKVYFLLRTGQLRSIKIGKLRRITDQHLTAFIESLEESNL
jgi:excisionase family DNA binding protein